MQRPSIIFVLSITCALSICFAGAVLDASANDLSTLTDRAERQIQNRLLKKAEGSLRHGLAKLQADENLSDHFDYHRLSILLAEVYLNSKQYEDALDWARRCRENLVRLSRHQQPSVSRRQDIAILFAKVYASRQDYKESIDSWSIALDLNRELDLVEPVRELELATRLGEALGLAKKSDEFAVVDAQVKQLMQSLERSFRGGLLNLDNYYRAVRIFANYLLSTKRSPDITAWERLVDKYARPPTPSNVLRQVDIWSQIAKSHRQAKAFDRETAALTEGLLCLLEGVRNGQPAVLDLPGLPVLNKVDQSVRVAEFNRRIAQSLEDAKCGARSIEHLGNAEQHYLTALRHLDRASVQDVNEQGRAEALKVRALEGLQAIADWFLRLSESEHASQRLTSVNKAIEVTTKVDEALGQTRLTRDPILRVLKTSLSSLHAKKAEFAEELGDLKTAEEHLEYALRICRDNSLNDELKLSIQLRLGAVLSRIGDYEQAFSHFDNVKKRAPKIPKAAKANEFELLALRSLGALYRSYPDAGDAEDTYGNLIDRHTKLVGESNPDVLVDYIPLIDLLIARQVEGTDELVSNDLESTLETAVGLCKGLPENDKRKLQVQDRQAMMHFLKHIDEPNSAERNVREMEAARSNWEKILKIQTEHAHPPVDQARTLHYLSRLSYLEWYREFIEWREEYRRDVATRPAQYEERLNGYEQRRKALVCQSDKYERDHDSYHDALDTYNANLGGQLGTLQAWHDRLRKQKEAISDERNALQKLRVRLDEEYKAEQASTADLIGGKKNRLNRILSDAAIRAKRTLKILVSSRERRNLCYLALCNHAEILNGQSVMDKEDPKSGNTPLLSKAIQQLQDAVELAESVPPTTSRDDDETVSFFAKNDIAFRLAIQLYKEKLGDSAKAKAYENKRQAIIERAKDAQWQRDSL